MKEFLKNTQNASLIFIFTFNTNILRGS